MQRKFKDFSELVSFLKKEGFISRCCYKHTFLIGTYEISTYRPNTGWNYHQTFTNRRSAIQYIKNVGKKLIRVKVEDSPHFDVWIEN